MKKLIFILLILLLSCKKEEITPVESGPYTKVIEIGDWNMNNGIASVQKNVVHGLDRKKIRSVSVLIRNDANAYTVPLDLYNSSDATLSGGVSNIDSEYIVLVQKPGGFFYSVDYDAVPYNRGWVTIIYE